MEGDCQGFSLQWEKENGSVITQAGGLTMLLEGMTGLPLLVGWNCRVSSFYVAGSFQCFLRELRPERFSYTASIDSEDRTRCIKVE
jgi:hypothetical protein